MCKEVKVGIIGCGVVGTGVVRCLLENKQLIAARIGVPLVLTKVADIKLDAVRDYDIPKQLFTNDAYQIINNEEIDIVVELIGGIEKAKEFILAALAKGKDVVTANKALLCECGMELHEAAQKNGCDLYYEASVGGAIPIIKVIREGLAANRFISIRGIINGTCNYILSLMTEKQITFEEALTSAIKNGFAEADPALDIDGIDSQHKISILAANCFGRWVPKSEIYVEGIRNISDLDIKCASELGYTIKLLARAEICEERIDVRVHPTLLPNKSILASVRDSYNAIEVIGDPAGKTLFYGKGAGMNPTASAVVADLIDVARNLEQETEIRVPMISFQPTEVKIKPIKEIESRYFLRWRTDDRPGVIAKISYELTIRNIGISSVILHEFPVVQPCSIVTFMTRETNETNIKEAISAIDQLDVIQTPTSMIRVDLNETN